MTEETFTKVFGQFITGYWGAFHEVLEAQSVTPKRLASSLFNELVAQHQNFETIYAGPAQSAVDHLGRIWRDVSARRYEFPDPPLTRVEVATAVELFDEIYNSLLRQGHKYASVKRTILDHAPHGTPKEPLRADATR